MSTRSRTAGARTRGRAAGAGRRGRLAPGKEARGLEAAQVAIALDSEHVADLATLVRAAGGAAIGAYQEPLGGRPLLLASLPLNAVQPTPFQRDLSPTHAKRLAAKIDETAAFLDPLIVVRGDDGRLWTPNGRHRLAAAKVLGMNHITAMRSPGECAASSPRTCATTSWPASIRCAYTRRRRETRSHRCRSGRPSRAWPPRPAASISARYRTPTLPGWRWAPARRTDYGRPAPPASSCSHHRLDTAAHQAGVLRLS